MLLLVAGATVFLAFAVYVGTARIGADRRGVFTQGTHRSNMVFVGLPIVVNAYGEGVVASAAVLIGVMVVVYNFLAVLVLILPHGRKGSGSRTLWIGTGLKIVRNPLILASGAGILFSASGSALPVCADRTLDLVGRIAMPLALLSVGASLDFGRLRSEVGPAATVCFLKLVAYPALVYAGLYLIGIRGVELEVPVLIMAAPTAVVSYIMAQEMKGDEQLAAAIVIGTTIASLFTISAWLFFFTTVG